MNKEEIIKQLIKKLEDLKKKHEFDYDIEIKYEPKLEELPFPMNLSPIKKVVLTGSKTTITIEEKEYGFLKEVEDEN